jgi:hypothetical protein
MTNGFLRCFLGLAEKEGFEPSVGSPLRLISSQVHSTTLPLLLIRCRLSKPPFYQGQPATTLPKGLHHLAHGHDSDSACKQATVFNLDSTSQFAHATHVGPQRLGHANAAVGLLVVF